MLSRKNVIECRMIVNTGKEFRARVDYHCGSQSKPKTFKIMRIITRGGGDLLCSTKMHFYVLDCFHVTSRSNVLANRAMVAHLDHNGRHMEVMFRDWTRDSKSTVMLLADDLIAAARDYTGSMRIEVNRATANSAKLASKTPPHLLSQPKTGVVPDDVREHERSRFASKYSPDVSASRKPIRREVKSVGMPRGFGKRMQQTILNEPGPQRLGQFSSYLVGRPRTLILKDFSPKSSSAVQRNTTPNKRKDLMSPSVKLGTEAKTGNVRKRLFSNFRNANKEVSPKRRRTGESTFVAGDDGSDGSDISPAGPKLISKSTGNTSAPKSASLTTLKPIRERVSSSRSVSKSKSSSSPAASTTSRCARSSQNPKLGVIRPLRKTTGPRRSLGTIVEGGRSQKEYGRPKWSSRSAPSSAARSVGAADSTKESDSPLIVSYCGAVAKITMTPQNPSQAEDPVSIVENADKVDFVHPNAPSPVHLSSYGFHHEINPNHPATLCTGPDMLPPMIDVHGSFSSPENTLPLHVGGELPFISAVDPNIEPHVEDIDLEISAIVEKPSDSLGTLSPGSLATQPTQTGGISNIGNTCYMASTLQLLLNDDVFMHQLRSKVGTISGGQRADCRMSNALLQLHDARARGQALDANMVKTSIEQYAPEFTGFRQQDAQEFITKLISLVHEELNAPLSECPIAQNFTSLTETYSQCFACRAKSEAKREINNNLMLKIPNDSRNAHSLLDLINEQFGAEKIEYKCEKCGKKAGANLVTQFVAAPRALVLNVNRVEFVPPNSRTKISHEVHVPKTLNLVVDTWKDIKKQVGDEFNYDTSLVTSPASDINNSSDVPNPPEINLNSSNGDGTLTKAKQESRATKRPRSPKTEPSSTVKKKQRVDASSSIIESQGTKTSWSDNSRTPLIDKNVRRSPTGSSVSRGSSASDRSGLSNGSFLSIGSCSSGKSRASSGSEASTASGSSNETGKESVPSSQRSQGRDAASNEAGLGAQSSSQFIKKYEEYVGGKHGHPSEVRYTLKGVVRHLGTCPYSGHYVADIKGEDGVWRTYNDSEVYLMAESNWNNVNMDGYMLYYVME